MVCFRGGGSGLLGGAVLNKALVLERIVARLVEELDLYLRAARTAASEATDEQSKAENKYDTRGLEASYLARGQARQAVEVEQAVNQFRALSTQAATPQQAVDVGVLLELKGRREAFWYFVGPRAGGTEVELDGTEITVITPQSPLGQQLMGRRVGDAVKMPSGEELRIRSLG